MTLIEFDELLAIMGRRGVQSASVDILEAHVAVAFEPRLPDPSTDPVPGGWKQTVGVTTAAPPQNLDLPQIWGDEPRSKD